MPELKKCRACGVEIQSNAPFGHCLQCLIALGFGPMPEELPKAPSISAVGTVRYFGDYELLEEIARGGMGTVFKARQTRLNRLVAIKVISAGTLATEELVKRFKAEAESAASLAHPNIVPIFEIGQHEGQHYFSMGLIEGGNLAEKLRRANRPHPEPGSRRGDEAEGTVASTSPPPHVGGYNPLSLRDGAQLLVKIARAVHYAHQRGVLHRDLKPSNILLDAKGQPHLTDFGLAKLIEKESTLTHTNAVMGTPAYMSPEQACGESKDVTTATDVYGLGAVLYETLTGSPPFGGGTSMETIRQVIDQEPRRPSILNPAVDRDLETICLKCLEKEPERRYASVEAFADDLEHWLRDEPILARRATLVERVTKWARRQPVLAAAVVLLHVVLLLGIGGVLWQWRRADHASRETSQSNDQLRRALGQMDSIQLQRAEEYFTEDRRADALPRWALVLRNNPSNRLAAERLMSTLSHRNWARLACPPLEHSNRVTFALFSHDGTKVVTSSADNTASVWDSTTGRRLAGPLIHAAEINTAIFSWDGKRVVTASKDKTARIWNAETGAPFGEPLQHDADVTSAQFSPDGNLVLTTRGHLGLFWSAETGERVGAVLEGGNYVYDARFSPNGDCVALACHSGEAQLWDVASRACLQRLKHASNVHSVAFSPDGSKLVAGSADKTARVWDVQSGLPIAEPFQHQDAVVGAEFSPDGRRVVTASRDKTAQIWDALTGQKLGPPLKHNDVVRGAMFSPEGLRVVTASWDKTVRVWDALTGKPLTEPMVHEKGVFGAQFSPDGERLLTASSSKEVLLWNIMGGTTLDLHFPGDVGMCRFSDDGKKLIVTTDGSQTRVWDPWTGQPLTPPLARAGDPPFSRACFTPDGRFVATITTSGSARVWNALDGQPVTERLEDEGPILGLVFSPDGRQLLSATPQSQTLWETKSGKILRRTPVRGMSYWSCFSPDGKSLLTIVESNIACLVDSHTGEPTTPPLVHQAAITWAEFSPDGRSVLTLAHDTSFAIWDTKTGRQSSIRFQHRQEPIWAFFSRDGNRALSLTTDYGAQLWNIRTGASIAGEFGAQNANAVGVGFDKDDGRAVIVHGDGHVQVWDSSSGQRLSERLPNHSTIIWAQRSSLNGQFAALSRWKNGGQATLWEIPSVALPVPKCVPELAEGLAGQRFNPQGQLEPVRSAELWAAQQQMAAWAAAQAPERGSPDPQQVGTTERAGISSIASLRIKRAAAGDSRAPADAFYARWARWFLGDARTRTVLPSSPLTLPQYAEQLRDQVTLGSLRLALRLQPENGHIMATLALKEDNPAYADWLSQRATELFPWHGATWWFRAELLGRANRLAEALELMARAEPLVAKTPWFYHDKGLLLEKADRPDDALVAYSKAIDVASALTNGTEQVQNSFLTRRYALLKRMDRHIEAQADFLASKGIPPRPPAAKTHPVDMSAHFNLLLADFALAKALGGETGHAMLSAANGVEFYMHGYIILDGAHVPTGHNHPRQATNIVVGEGCRALHFLHSCGWCKEHRDGTRLGAYVVRYSDGEQREIPIVYGEDVAQLLDARPQLTRATEAWKGTNDFNQFVRLYQFAWTNPRPEVEIQSIDFVSAKADCSPILFAISAEP